MWLSFRGPDGSAHTVEATGERFVVGRDEEADLPLDDEKASRRHASLELLPDGRAILTDLGSTNGTFVDGERIERPLLLAGGEEIRIGQTVLTASVEEPGEAPAPEAGATVIEPVSAAASGGPSTPPSDEQFPGVPPSTPSRIERLKMSQSLRRTQIMAAVLGVLAIVGITVGILFAAGVLGGDDQATAADVVEAATPSTLLMRGVQDGQTFGAGTGWVYDAEQGLVVTNAHVVNTYPEFKVSVGSETTERDAEMVAVAPCDDLAVLRVEDTSGFATMPLGSQADLKQGQEVVALGYPTTEAAGSQLGGALVATDGVVSIVSTPATAYSNLRFPNVIQTDAAINPGNSGGPLMDLDGELVGVNTFVSSRQAQNFAIGVDRVKEVVPRLAEGTSIGWSGLGFYEPTSPEELTQLGLPDFQGLVITNAKPGTFAADAGLGEGPFLVVAINGNPIDTTLRSYCNEVGDLRRDESAVFTVFAPGSEEPQDITVRFN